MASIEAISRFATEKKIKRSEIAGLEKLMRRWTRIRKLDSPEMWAKKLQGWLFLVKLLDRETNEYTIDEVMQMIERAKEVADACEV